MLSSIQKMTLFREKVPLHTLPEAQLKDTSKSDSSIFVVDYAEFLKMKTSEIQCIFKKKHILVLNHHQEELFKFDRQGLSRMGNMAFIQDMQGIFELFFFIKDLIPVIDISLRSPINQKTCLQQFSLEEMYEESIKEEKELILNALDIKLGPNTIVEPPRYL
jgi:hypothetical protein